MVPKRIVMHATSMTILLIIRADDLFINNKFNFLFESVVLKIKIIKEKPVITKKSINIKMPRDESAAKE